MLACGVFWISFPSAFNLRSVVIDTPSIWAASLIVINLSIMISIE